MNYREVARNYLGLDVKKFPDVVEARIGSGLIQLRRKQLYFLTGVTAI